MLTEEQEERFWAKVAIPADVITGCWIWTASRVRGYGQFNAGGRTMRAHRIAYEAVLGPIPDGLHLAHGPCHNPSCVNPHHLSPATPRENAADKVRDGTAPIGVNHGNCRLSPADIATIRSRRSGGELLRLIAVDYGVSESHVASIFRGRRRRLG